MNCIQTLKDSGVNFLMPATKGKRVKDEMEKGVPRVLDFEYGVHRDDPVRFSLAVAEDEDGEATYLIYIGEHFYLENMPRKVSEDEVERMKFLREEGLTYREIAEELGFSRSTVNKYLGRARGLR